jgi:hypothetical protein
LLFGGILAHAPFLHGKLSDPVSVIATVGKQHCPGLMREVTAEQRDNHVLMPTGIQWPISTRTFPSKA